MPSEDDNHVDDSSLEIRAIVMCLLKKSVRSAFRHCCGFWFGFICMEYIL